MPPAFLHRHFTTHHSTCYKCSRSARHISPATTATAASKQHAPPVQQLSTVLLVNENLRRRLGRGLIESHQLLQAVELVEQADYALLVVKAPGSASDVSQHLQSPERCQVSYANAAALQLLCLHSQRQLQSVLLPSIAATDWHTAAAAPQQQPQQQQQQQQSPCRVCKAVSWKYDDDEEVVIHQMLICPVDAPNGTYVGLAVLFDRWSYPEDGCIGAPGHPKVHINALPTDQQLQQAADAVRQQADVVRNLKQGQGLGNKDIQVIQAVADLQQRKQELTQLESLQTAFHANKHGLMQQLLEACQQM